jgi:hypothetical protein
MSLGPSSATAPAKDAGNYVSTQIKRLRTNKRIRAALKTALISRKVCGTTQSIFALST